MCENNNQIIERLIDEYPKLEICKRDIKKAFLLLKQCYSLGGKVLVCGNGGSAADSEHIVGELMKGFRLKRKLSKTDRNKIKYNNENDWEYLSENLQRALPAISLTSQVALSTAVVNDLNSDMVFAQQVYGYGKKNDVLIGISTSGNSKNVVNAVKIANSFGIKTIGLTGNDGGMLKKNCNVTILAPENEVYKIQEYHLPIYHALCAEIEKEFFGNENT